MGSWPAVSEGDMLPTRAKLEPSKEQAFERGANLGFCGPERNTPRIRLGY